MSSTPTSTVIAARVQPQHAEQLRQIAYRNASTVSRTVARIVELDLAGEPSAKAEQ
jgi:hypothetical protein